jgi:hypothetical protein
MNVAKVWVSKYALDCVDLSNLNNPENRGWFTYSSDDLSKSGYTLIGMAEIEHSFFDRNLIQGYAVDAIKTQIQEVRAEAENKVTHLQDKINQLLAITNEA